MHYGVTVHSIRSPDAPIAARRQVERGAWPRVHQMCGRSRGVHHVPFSRPFSVFLTKRYLDFAHFYGRAFLTSSSTLRGKVVSVVREKEVFSIVPTSSCEPFSSIPNSFHGADLAKGRATD